MAKKIAKRSLLSLTIRKIEEQDFAPIIIDAYITHQRALPGWRHYIVLKEARTWVTLLCLSGSLPPFRVYVSEFRDITAHRTTRVVDIPKTRLLRYLRDKVLRRKKENKARAENTAEADAAKAAAKKESMEWKRRVAANGGSVQIARAKAEEESKLREVAVSKDRSDTLDTLLAVAGAVALAPEPPEAVTLDEPEIPDFLLRSKPPKSKIRQGDKQNAKGHGTRIPVSVR